MKKKNNLFLGLLFCGVMVLGSIQGHRVEHLRQSQAFYEWLLATSSNIRMEWDHEEQYADYDLYTEITQLADPVLLDVQVGLEESVEKLGDQADEELVTALQHIRDEAAAAEKDIALLTLFAAESKFDQHIWDLARDSEFRDYRESFLTLARDQKLFYAQSLQYSDIQKNNVNIFNVFLGFRKLAANFLWMNVDRYWHAGSVHKMIPAMKSTVLLDPNFIDAYLIGSWHISYNVTATIDATPAELLEWDEEHQVCIGEKERYYYIAIDLLKDGIRNNPRNYKLYFDLGFAIYKIKLKDHVNSAKYLAEAVRQPHDRWVPRQLYIVYELAGEYEKARNGWLRYVEQFPDSSTTTDIAPRFIKRNEGKILEREAEALIEQADATSDDAERVDLIARADAILLQARRTWMEVKGPYGEYRLVRLDAHDLVAEGKYLDAIAILDKARWEVLTSFDEISDYIIEIKQQANIPLTVSELKSVLRKEVERKPCIGEPVPE